MIELIQIKSGIKDILDIFTPYLETLRMGSVNKDVFAEKIYRCGKTIILKEEDQLIGFASFYCNNVKYRIAFLSLIAVKPEYGNQGYGGQLLSAVKLISREAGMDQLRLEVRKQNKAAISFYKKEGFSILDCEKNYTFCLSMKLYEK